MKNIKIIAMFTASLLVTWQMYGQPGGGSLRSSSTAGLFGDAYDMLQTAPYFIGATSTEDEKAEKQLGSGALPLGFQNSATVGKTNIFTNLNSVSGNSYLAGSVFSIGSLGLGFYTEVNNNQTPRFINGLFGSGTGNYSWNDILFIEPTPGVYTGKTVTSENGEKNQSEFDLNFKVALNYILGSSMAAGFTVERYTTGSSDIIGKVDGTQTTTDLINNLVTSTQTYAYDLNDTINVSHNIGLFHFALAGSTILALQLGADYQTDSQIMAEKTTDNLTTQTTRTPGSNNWNIDFKDSGIVGIGKLSVALNAAGLEIEIAPGMNIGSGAVNGIGKDTTINVVNNMPIPLTNSANINTTKTTTTIEIIKDKNSDLGFNFDLIAKKQIENTLLIGFGVKTSYQTRDTLNPVKTTGLTVITVNNGDGIPDPLDTVSTTTSNNTANLNTITKDITIELPVGLEYLITPALSLRSGVTHRWNRNLVDTINTPVSSRTVTKTVNALGVETVTYGFDNFKNKSSDRQIRVTQMNILNLGIGYTALKNVQLDLEAGSSVNGGTIGVANVNARATLLF